MALNLHLLRIFATVVERESFSAAAQALYISQPAVSKGVRELERQLGTTLLDRSQRTLTLTEAGVVLHRHARQLFAVERAAELDLAQLRGLERGQLSIGASSTIGIYLLPPLLGAFHARFPDVRLFLDIGNTREIAERLRTAPLDVAFVEGPVEEAELEVTPWRDDTLAVIAAPEHPLVERQPVSLARLLEEPFMLRERGSGTREVIETALAARDARLRVAMELGSTEAIKQTVSAGLGLAIVSVATIGAEVAVGRLRVLDVPELSLRRRLTRLSIAGRPASPALRTLLASLAANDDAAPPDALAPRRD